MTAPTAARRAEDEAGEGVEKVCRGVSSSPVVSTATLHRTLGKMRAAGCWGVGRVWTLKRFVSTLWPDAEMCTRLVRLEMEHKETFRAERQCCGFVETGYGGAALVLQQSAGRLA